MTQDVGVRFSGSAAGAVGAARATATAIGTVRAEASGLSPSLRTAEHDTGRLSRGLLAGSGALSGFGRSIAFASGSFLGGAGLIAGLKGAYEQAETSRKALDSLGVVIRRNNGDVAAATPLIEKWAAGQKQFGVSIADSEQGLARAAAVTGSVQAAMVAYNEALVISKATGKDLNAVLIAASKAQNGQTSALARYIGTVPKGTTAQQLYNDVMAKYRGQAESNTSATDRLRASLANVELKIGRDLLPTVNKYANELDRWLSKSQNQKRITDDVTKAVHLMGGALGDARRVIELVDKATGGLQNTMKILIGLKVASVLKGWTVALDGLIGTEAAAGAAGAGGLLGAETAAGGLLGKLTKLKALGTISIAVLWSLSQKGEVQNGGAPGLVQWKGAWVDPKTGRYVQVFNGREYPGPVAQGWIAAGRPGAGATSGDKARANATNVHYGLGSGPGSSAAGYGGGFVPKGSTFKKGRVDQGQDFQTDPGGPIIAPGDGVCTGVHSDPGGFGPDYPTVHFTSGPYKGATLYIGHTHSALRVGQKFNRGQIIAHTGFTGVGNATVPGWAEIGYWGASGPVTGFTIGGGNQAGGGSPFGTPPPATAAKPAKTTFKVPPALENGIRRAQAAFRDNITKHNLDTLVALYKEEDKLAAAAGHAQPAIGEIASAEKTYRDHMAAVRRKAAAAAAAAASKAADAVIARVDAEATGPENVLKLAEAAGAPTRVILADQQALLAVYEHEATQIKARLAHATGEAKTKLQQALSNIGGLISSTQDGIVGSLQSLYQAAAQDVSTVIGNIQTAAGTALGNRYFQNGLQTPAEAALAAMQAQDSASSLADALTQAQQQLQTDTAAGASPAVIAADNAAISSANRAIQENQLAVQAAAERKKADDDYAKAVYNLNQSLANAPQTVDGVNAALGQFGLTLSGLSDPGGNGLLDQLTAAALAAANALNKLTVAAGGTPASGGTGSAGGGGSGVVTPHRVLAFAGGGKVPGPRVNRDMIPSFLTPGETVIDRRLTTALEQLFLGGGGLSVVAGDVYLDGQKVGKHVARGVTAEQARQARGSYSVAGR